MMQDAPALWAWLIGAIVLIIIASLYTRHTYHAFLAKSRGPATYALPAVADQTPLDRLLSDDAARHPGQDGLLLLLDNHDAFAARVLATLDAGRSLDLMYYIWRTDLSGLLLIHHLLAAADRGVRVRLLLDDVNVQGFDRTFLALTQHPLIDVRLFNPIRQRGHVLRRAAEMLLGLSRFNRRMHGKMWIADGRLAIMGGRNIGNTYFDATDGDGSTFDADILITGPKVSDVSDVFDSYWNLGLSLPIKALWPQLKDMLPAFRTRLAAHAATPAARTFMSRALADRTTETFVTARLKWTDTVTLLADPPEKALNEHRAPWMDTAVLKLLGTATTEARLITPYFVPGKDGLAGLIQLAERGVRISVITNALSATNSIMVHGAYSTYRAPLLQAGARIFELSRPAPRSKKHDMLHSKVFLVDRQRAIVGSLNFDLRSAHINTELGLLFEEPTLLAELQAMSDMLAEPRQSYEVTRDGDTLYWAVARPGLPAVLTADPEAGPTRRAISWLVGQLPIQSYL